MDSGAEITVVSTAFANFAGMVQPGLANVADTDIGVQGFNGTRSEMQVLRVALTLGGKFLPERTHLAEVGVF